MNHAKPLPLAILIIALMNACLNAAGVVVVSEDSSTSGQLPQDNYVHRLWQLHPESGLTPNDPNQLPVLGPVTHDPNAWEVPCGPWRRGGTWKDPENMPVTVSLLASDLANVEVSTGPDGSWALTVPWVTLGWHYARVRATDTPPPGSKKIALRDVEIWWLGVERPNDPPVLY